ncbi:DUF7144 family membrane protein [Virgisporangium aurantiacum]|uniref:Membrane protein n=1 Tax=Virgisporangium aurantiacum TaxID=175570 RepID=A0A8J3Z1K6_9ACTN|nr:hypothetical protein [Virgisporangium aurantiacum]GIJ55604.1 membrane protein [Virgisporangium aurantiacum]
MTPPTTSRPAPRLTPWVGWIVFAGLVMIAGGVLNMIQGLVALLDEDYYAAQSDLMVDVSYQVWGWTLLLFGAFVAAAGYELLSGRMWARWVAVVLLAFDALLNFAFAASYPFWSVIAISLDVIVIYALVVHGREVSR